MNRLTVILRSPISGRLVDVEIESLTDGQTKVRENTDYFGSGEWYGYRDAKKENCIGTVKYNGTPIGMYSYNSILWEYENAYEDDAYQVEINDNTLSLLIDRITRCKWKKDFIG